MSEHQKVIEQNVEQNVEKNIEKNVEDSVITKKNTNVQTIELSEIEENEDIDDPISTPKVMHVSKFFIYISSVMVLFNKIRGVHNRSRNGDRVLN